MTLVHLSKLFGRDMKARGLGWILQVSSIDAFQPPPPYATYAAAKSFVLNFTEALSYELLASGVKVSALSPGVTATELLEVSGQKGSLYQRVMMMSSAAVVRVGIRGMLRGTPSVIPGLMKTLGAFMMRFTPRRFATTTSPRQRQLHVGIGLS